MSVAYGIELGSDQGAVTAAGASVELGSGEQEDPLGGGLALGGRRRLDAQELAGSSKGFGLAGWRETNASSAER